MSMRIGSFGAAIVIGFVVTPATADIIDVPTDFPTIQAAIDAAVPGDEVVVADGTYLGSGNVDLDFGGKDITVRSANGVDHTTIDCQEAGRAFIFQSGETAAAVVEGFRIVNGLVVEAGGGAIAITGSSPTIRDCDFEGNTAYSEVGAFPVGSGGAIHAVDGSSPTIEGCNFVNNTAGFESSAIGTGFGGAIFMFTGSGTVTDSTFTGNLADGPGGFGNGIGGGVGVFFANPSFDTCTFEDNDAVIAGGGIWLQGSATTDIGNCTFTGNTAQSGGGLAAFEAAATVHDSTFDDNSVASADPLVQQQIGGGAIGCADNVTILISHCSFTGNTSHDGVGGAVSSIGGSTATVEFCDFTNNSAATTGGAVHSGSAPGSEDPDLELPSTLTMTSCTLLINDAEGGGGGASNQHGSTMSIFDSEFEGNFSSTATGAFPTGSGGGVASVASTSIIEGCTFTDNKAGFETSAVGTGFGGGLFMFMGGGTVTDSTFTGNLADGPGGFGNGIGGGVGVFFASPTFDTCAFAGNDAVIAGGGLWLQGSATTDVGNCFFFGNTAQSGGGLAAFEAAATVHDSSFVDNHVASSDPLVQQQIGGGGIGSADNVIIDISRCVFTGNTSASGVGGAVSSIGGSTTTIQDCEFSANSAGTDGGAVHNGAAPGSGDADLELPSTMTVIASFVANNAARGGGGGLSNRHGSAMTVTGCTVDRNAATEGGGLANLDAGSTASVDGCTIAENTAVNAGGGIKSAGSTMDLEETVVCGNTPDQIDGTVNDLGGNVIADTCTPDCAVADIDGSGDVGFDDLLIVLSTWGPCDGVCPGDVNGNLVVGFDDLLIVLANWGICE